MEGGGERCGKTLEWRGGQPLETAKRKIPDQLPERVKICNFKAKTLSIKFRHITLQSTCT
jgi:hypothetical protein